MEACQTAPSDIPVAVSVFDKYVTEGKYLTKKAESCYKACDRLSQGAEVSVTSPNVCYITYQGTAVQNRRTVDLEAKTCSCTKWQQFKLPCHHAIAAARATNRLGNMRAWYDHAFGAFYLASLGSSVCRRGSFHADGGDTGGGWSDTTCRACQAGGQATEQTHSQRRWLDG